MACGCGSASGQIRVARAQQVTVVMTTIVPIPTARQQTVVIERHKEARIHTGVRSGRDVDRFRDQ